MTYDKKEFEGTPRPLTEMQVANDARMESIQERLKALVQKYDDVFDEQDTIFIAYLRGVLAGLHVNTRSKYWKILDLREEILTLEERIQNPESQGG